ncbi:MAG: Lysozyme inhibitor LprI [Verrucomicrobiota bacterium]
MRMLPLFVGSTALLLAVMPIAASYGQDPNSKRPGTEEGAVVEQANTELDGVYKRLMSKLDTDGQKALKDAERSWIKWRDDEALLIARAGGAIGGSSLRVDFLTAQARLIRQRTEVLDGYLKQSAGN